MIDANKILPALRKVIDPVSGKHLLDAKMVRDLKVDGHHVSFTLLLPDPNAPYKDELIFSCIGEIQTIYPEAEVDIHVAVRSSEDGSENPLPQVQNYIAVASGKGGVGKSTVAVNLAVALHRAGYRTGILDTDLYGPSVPTMLGMQGVRPEVHTIYGVPMMIPPVYNGMPVMSIGFVLRPEQAVVMRGPRLSSIVQQFIRQCRWPELDYLIIDLPPGTGDIQLTLVQTLPLTGALIVTTPQEVAIADALKAANMFRLENIGVPILGIVENMAWFTPAELPDHKYFLFGRGGAEKLAHQIDAPLLAQIPLVMSIREGGDSGVPAALHRDKPEGAVWYELVDRFVHAVEERNRKLEPTKIVKNTTR